MTGGVTWIVRRAVVCAILLWVSVAAELMFQSPSDFSLAIIAPHHQQSSKITVNDEMVQVAPPKRRKFTFSLQSTKAAQTLWVSPGGSGDQSGSDQSNALPDIGSALQKVGEGGTIKLLPGTYSSSKDISQEWNVNKNYTLTSSGGAEKTILDCKSPLGNATQNSGIILTQKSNTTSYGVAIEGISIQNCYVAVYGKAPELGLYDTTFKLTLSSSHITYNVHAVSLSHVTSTFTSCVFSDNANNVIKAPTRYDVFAFTGGFTEYNSCIFANNTWSQGSLTVISCVMRTFGRFSITKSTFENNRVQYTERTPPVPMTGMFCLKSAGDIIDSKFINNAASSGSVLSVTQFDVDHCAIDNVRMPCLVNVNNTEFADNYALDGIVRVSNDDLGNTPPIVWSKPSFNYCSFHDNVGTYAGAFVIAGAWPTIRGCVFRDNQLFGVTTWFREGLISSGSDLSILGDSVLPGPRAHVYDTTFYGAGLRSLRKNAIDSSAVYISESSYTIFRNCTFEVRGLEPALSVSSAASSVFDGCTFTTPPGGTAEPFSIIQLRDATPSKFTNCFFRGISSNTHQISSADTLRLPTIMRLAGGVAPVIENSLFHIGHINNTNFGSSGIACLEGSSPILMNVTFVGMNGGLAVLAYQQAVTALMSLDTCTVTGSWYFPAIYLVQQVTAIFTNCIFTKNQIHVPFRLQGAGLVFVSEAFVTFNQTVFVDNLSTALGVWWISQVTIADCEFLNNTPDSPSLPNGIYINSATVHVNRSAVCGPPKTTSVQCGNTPGRGDPKLVGSLTTPPGGIVGCNDGYVPVKLHDLVQVTEYACANSVLHYEIDVSEATAGIFLNGTGAGDVYKCHVYYVDPISNHTIYWDTETTTGSWAMNVTYKNNDFKRNVTYFVDITAGSGGHVTTMVNHLQAGIYLPRSSVSVRKSFWGMLFTNYKTTVTVSAFNQFGERLLARSFPPLALVIDGKTTYTLTSRDLDAIVTLSLGKSGSHSLQFTNPNGEASSIGMTDEVLTTNIVAIWVGWVYIVGIGILVIVIGSVGFFVHRRWKKTHDALKARSQQQARLLEEFTRAGPAQIQHNFLEKYENARTPCVVVLDSQRHAHICCEFPGRWHLLPTAHTYDATKVKITPDFAAASQELNEVFEKTDFNLSTLEWSDTLVSTVPPAYDGTIDPTCITRFFLRLADHHSRYETSSTGVSRASSTHDGGMHWSGLTQVMLPGGQPAWVCEEHKKAHHLEPFKPFDLPKSIKSMMKPLGNDDEGLQFMEIPHPDMIPPHSAVFPIVEAVRRELTRMGGGEKYHITRIKVFCNEVLEQLFNQRYELLTRPGRKELARPWPPTAPGLRRDIMDTLSSQHLARMRHNPATDHNVNLDLVWHGAAGGDKALNNIAKLGFLNLAKLNNGWHGRGAYFSHYPEYAEFYACASHNRTEFGEHALLLSWALLGQTYPVIDRMDRVTDPEHAWHGGYGGHDSHYARVLAGGATSREAENGHFVYDEVVIQQENQLLPQFIVYYFVDETLTASASTNKPLDQFTEHN